VSTAVAQGYPLVFGRWAGLAAPRHPQGRPALAPDRLAAAFVQAQMHVRATGEGGEAGWQVVPAAAFVRFLKDLHEQWKQRANRPGRPEMPRGKVAGFLLGALGLVCFPWFMDLAGFPLAT